MDLTGCRADDLDGRVYAGSESSSSTAVGVAATTTADSRPSTVALPSHRPACRTGTVDSQYASMSTMSSTASASSNVDDVDDDVMRFIESHV